MAAGHGGRRPGAGRKPKSAAERRLDGNANHRGRVLPHPSSAGSVIEPDPPPVEEFDAPDDLPMDARHVWMRLAPFAFANRTLTKATMFSFCLLCRNITLEKRYAESVNDAGGANHRGLIQRIDAELLRFNLAPCGKPISTEMPEPVADPLKARYFGGA